jgi:lipoic acid synthetase
LKRKRFIGVNSKKGCVEIKQMPDEKKQPKNLRRPEWLRVKAPGDKRYLEVRRLLQEHNLHTVCQEANCPNRGECFSSGTATFLILGPNCTRNCRFCNITNGPVLPPDASEPDNVARTVDLLDLRHAVITSVTRDDLPDGGAAQFAGVIRAIQGLSKRVTIEVLTPDFRGNIDNIMTVLEAGPDVFNHNVETVPRLYPAVRPEADYEISLGVLNTASDTQRVVTKSGLMVGLGETVEELARVFTDLSEVGVDFLTIGQYLPPSRGHYPVVRYYHPTEFEALAERAQNIGIGSVFSAPLVRSSYHAGEQYNS